MFEIILFNNLNSISFEIFLEKNSLQNRKKIPSQTFELVCTVGELKDLTLHRLVEVKIP